MVRRLGASFPVKVAILSAYQTLGYDRPTEDQERAVTEFMYGRDVFISLPTGSGKSLCFICLPLVFEYLRLLSNCGTRRELCCAGAGGGGQLSAICI